MADLGRSGPEAKSNHEPATPALIHRSWCYGSNLPDAQAYGCDCQEELSESEPAQTS